MSSSSGGMSFRIEVVGVIYSAVLPPRVVIGGVIGLATRAIFKPTSYFTVCTILQVSAHQYRRPAQFTVTS